MSTDDINDIIEASLWDGIPEAIKKLLELREKVGTAEFTKLISSRGTKNVTLGCAEDNYYSPLGITTPLIISIILHGYAEGGYDETLINFLVDNGADVNIYDESRATPLYYATAHCLLDVMQLLIDNGADVNHKNIDGTALIYVSYNFDAVVCLLKNGADPNMPFCCGNMEDNGKTKIQLLSAIYDLSSHHIQQYVSILLKYGANLNGIHLFNIFYTIDAGLINEILDKTTDDEIRELEVFIEKTLVESMDKMLLGNMTRTKLKMYNNMKSNLAILSNKIKFDEIGKYIEQLDGRFANLVIAPRMTRFASPENPFHFTSTTGHPVAITNGWPLVCYDEFDDETDFSAMRYSV
jgi:hypothetical protein